MAIEQYYGHVYYPTLSNSSYSIIYRITWQNFKAFWNYSKIVLNLDDDDHDDDDETNSLELT